MVLVTGFDDATVTELFESEDGRGAWKMSPLSLTWSADGKEFYMSAEDHCRQKLFRCKSLESPSLSDLSSPTDRKFRHG